MDTDSNRREKEDGKREMGKEEITTGLIEEKLKRKAKNKKRKLTTEARKLGDTEK